jgi:hypothetical protein
MLGDIVKVGFLRKDVLGVVLSEREHGYKNTYCIIARSTLEATDENIEVLKDTKLEDLLSYSTSSRFGNQLKTVGQHKESLTVQEKVVKYQNKYRPMRAIELVDISQKHVEEMDDLHLYAFLDVANEKGVYNVVSSLMAK